MHHLDTRYSHLQLPVVVLKCLYNLSNHLTTGYNAELKQLQKNWLRMIALSSLEVIGCPLSYNTGIDEVDLPLIE